MSWEQALTRADNHSQKQDGFYISRRDVWGKKLFILATQKENSTHLFKIARYEIKSCHANNKYEMVCSEIVVLQVEAYTLCFFIM
jgi:hypothetical protein